MVAPDGLAFLPSSLRVAPIRAEDSYGGLRATIQAHLGKARLHVQVDVGIGDAVSPEPAWTEYPALLDLPRPRLRAYRPETAIAEKLFDIHALAQHGHFEGDVLVRAVRATFERRRTRIPDTLPLALTPAFATSPQKQIQWQAFLRKNGGLAAPNELSEVVPRLAAFS